MDVGERGERREEVGAQQIDVGERLGRREEGETGPRLKLQRLDTRGDYYIEVDVMPDARVPVYTADGKLAGEIASVKTNDEEPWLGEVLIDTRGI